MANTRLSAGVETAWQIGADFALQTASEFIEPIHILYGLFSLKKYTDGPTSSQVTPSRMEEIRREAAELANLCEGVEPNISDIRKDIRQSFSNTRNEHDDARKRMSRSPATRKAFENAHAAADPLVVDAPRLLMAILDVDDVWVAKHIPDNLALRLHAAFAPEPQDTITAPRLGAALISTPAEPDIHISQSLDAGARVPTGVRSLDDRFALLCELGWEFGIHSSLEPMLQSFSEQLLKILPKAERASVLFSTGPGGDLLLKAHAPTCPHNISSTCARRAIAEQKSFLWRREGDLTESQSASSVQSGIYAPLVAEGAALGVICVDTSSQTGAFDESDLYLITAVAHQLALAIANRNLQIKLSSNAEVLERLLTNFSPQVRKRLLQRAQQGRLRLGGERSQVTILCSDIRGFTRLSANMDAEDIVTLLNEYFSALTDCIFRHDGTIDKFVGDAILAVFGSPDPDPQHRRKAVSAAFDMQKTMQQVNQWRAQRSEPVCEIGIGIHTGEVLHGFIGSVQRMEFTVIGDTVNKTSRYCDGAKAGEILISPEVHQHVWRLVEGMPVSISTKHEGDLAAYRIVALRSNTASH